MYIIKVLFSIFFLNIEMAYAYYYVFSVDMYAVKLHEHRGRCDDVRWTGAVVV